jgi:hypothetical protein
MSARPSRWVCGAARIGTLHHHWRTTHCKTICATLSLNNGRMIDRRMDIVSCRQESVQGSEYYPKWTNKKGNPITRRCRMRDAGWGSGNRVRSERLALVSGKKTDECKTNKHSFGLETQNIYPPLIHQIHHSPKTPSHPKDAIQYYCSLS